MSVLRRAYIAVEPTTKGFDGELTKQLRRVDPGGKAGRQIGLQMNRALARVNLDAIDVKADPKSALAAIAVTERKLRELSGEAATVEVKVRTEKALGDLARFKKQLGTDFGKVGGESAGDFSASFSQRLGPLIAKLPVSGPMAAVLGGAAVAASPFIGATIASAVIGGAGVGGVVGGLVVASKDARVKGATEAFAARLQDRLEKAGGGFVPPALAGLSTIEAAVNRVGIEDIFRDSARFVAPLAKGVGFAVEQLGAGVEKLVANAGPVVDVISAGIGDLGDAVGDVFTSLSDNGVDAAVALKQAFLLFEGTIRGIGVVLNGLTEAFGFLAKLGAFGQDAAREYVRLEANAKIAAERARELGDAQVGVVTKLDLAAAAARGQTGALVGLATELRAQADPAFAFITAQNNLKVAQDKATEAVKEHGRGSREAKEATRALALAALDLQGKAGALGSEFAGGLTPAMAATFRAAGLTEKQIKDVQGQLVAAKGAAEKYSGKYAAAVSLTGYQSVLERLINLAAYQGSLKAGGGIQAIRKDLSRDNADFLKNATGGHVRGPGTRTSDSIPALLSDYEYVVNADATEKIGVKNLDYMNKYGELPALALAAGGRVGWPYPVTAAHTRVPSLAEVASKVIGAFGNWPSSPSAQRGDSGIWRSILALVRGAGFNAPLVSSYRPGDPKWHGSGRADDFGGFNQDGLASFLAAKRPLELIHRTKRRDYAYTRGVNKGSFNESLMNAHRNHLHIAMQNGGVIREPVFGYGRSGASYSFAERGPERVTPAGASGATVTIHAPISINGSNLSPGQIATAVSRELGKQTDLYSRSAW